MLWELKKLLSALVYPLGTASLLLLIGMVLLLLHKRRWGLGSIATGLAWLWLWSTPVFSDWARGSLEEGWPHLTAAQAPSAEAIVVLGGAFRHKASWPQPNASAAVDRYWHAARLYHAGKAPWVILSGGRSPGLGLGMTESASGLGFLLDLGVAPEAISVDEQALTTRGNAVHVATMLEQRGTQRFLLVTSALHMRRSVAAFRAVGLNPIPVATDFEVSPTELGIRDFLPSAPALAASTRALHEWVGLWVYRWRGWAD